jgi:hypothetical protein
MQGVCQKTDDLNKKRIKDYYGWKLAGERLACITLAVRLADLEIG